MPYISLCDYCDPCTELEDDKTVDFYGLQPRSSVELRRIITLNAALKDKAGQTLKQDSFIIVIKYLDDRILSDLINNIRMQMDLPKIADYSFEINGSKRYGSNLIRNLVCDDGEEIHCIFKSP